MAKGISIKDDILDFEIGTKMTKEVEMILRRPLVNMDVQDVSLAEVENRNSKLMQEERADLIGLWIEEEWTSGAWTEGE
jgi:hypothetical protein